MVKALRKWSIAWLVYLISRLLYATYRYKIIGIEHRRAAEAKFPAICLALWHEQILAVAYGHKGQSKFCPVVSASADGEMVAFTCKRLGFSPVRGSTHRDGAIAKRDLLDALANGEWGAISVDGPKGPRRIVKRGIIDIAAARNAGIIPTIAIADRAWYLPTWDQVCIPKPFARITLAYAAAICPMIHNHRDIIEYRNIVRTKMLELEQMAIKQTRN